MNYKKNLFIDVNKTDNMYSKPSMNNIYESNFSEYVKKDQITRGTNLWNKAQNPLDTGIIGYSSQFMDYNKMDDMTGKNLTHNNMTPFLKGNVTQNTNFSTEYFSVGPKKETECFFKPQKNMHNICGMKNNDDFYKSRINNFDIRHRNNDFPIEPIRVGPGLNQGYTSKGSGGFHQGDTLKYTIPADLQKNKPKSDQRERIFNIPIQAPAKKIDKRGLIGETFKNRPETDYERNEDMLFKTTGSEIKPTSRAIPNLLPTNKIETHVEYKGVAVDTEKKQGLQDDYGKSSVLVYDNERQITETRTVVSNVTSVVKAMIAPVVDTMKNSIKEYLIDAPRQNGNIQSSMTERPTVYDPVNHSMRTTIKETTIHDNDKTNLKGEDGTYTALQDQVKTTTKETLIHDNEKLNLKGADKTYTGLYDKTKTTTKETTPIYDIMRNIGTNTYKITVYDPDIVAKTTNKQTTIKEDYGFLGGFIEGLFGGYLTTNPEAKNTQKQFTTVEYTGVGDVMSKHPMSQEAAYNAEIDGTREAILIAAGHTPNAGGKFVGLPKENVNMKSEKLMEDSIAMRQAGNISKIYQQAPEKQECVITKENEQLNSLENRLDPTTLNSLNDNPFSIKINDINPTCSY